MPKTKITIYNKNKYDKEAFLSYIDVIMSLYNDFWQNKNFNFAKSAELLQQYQ